MPKRLVNLDALIRREDFQVRSEIPQQPALTQSFRASDLEPTNVVYQIMRKPDFQRETANWDPEKVVDLIQSFLEGDLIPAVILWRAPNGNIFSIDGAHRLSAIIAWVNDDYGDRQISVPFFGGFIPPEQEKAAELTRSLVKERVGSFAELKSLAQYPDAAAGPEHLRYAKNLGVHAINVQWIPGDASKAELSYFKINQKATIIDHTELEMIQARRKPNALSTRAIIRAGTGHKYWSAFPQSIQDNVEAIGREVYDVLFKPAIETPIKTLDLPIAGRGYSAESVKMIFDLVNYLNGVPSCRSRNGKLGREKGEGVVSDDADGAATVQFLKRVQRVASRIAGTSPESLGLHPAVYFYGATGRFQPTSFLATVAFVLELDAKRRMGSFVENRYRFEEFLVRYRHFPNLIAKHKGAAQRGLQSTLTMYRGILASIEEGMKDEEIVEALQGQPQLSFLQTISEEDKKYGRNFSTDTKQAVFLSEALQKELRCGICSARLHFKSISMDHVVRKDDGGTAAPENAQLSHPYCNTGVKEKLGTVRLPRYGEGEGSVRKHEAARGGGTVKGRTGGKERLAAVAGELAQRARGYPTLRDGGEPGCLGRLVLCGS